MAGVGETCGSESVPIPHSSADRLPSSRVARDRDRGARIVTFQRMTSGFEERNPPWLRPRGFGPGSVVEGGSEVGGKKCASAPGQRRSSNTSMDLGDATALRAGGRGSLHAGRRDALCSGLLGSVYPRLGGDGGPGRKAVCGGPKKRGPLACACCPTALFGRGGGVFLGPTFLPDGLGARVVRGGVDRENSTVRRCRAGGDGRVIAMPRRWGRNGSACDRGRRAIAESAVGRWTQLSGPQARRSPPRRSRRGAGLPTGMGRRDRS